MNTEISPILQFCNLTLGYNRHPAVHHLSAEIKAGTMLAIIGPNGAGKSTLLKGIVGEIKPFEGEIKLHGVALEKIAYLPQQSTLDSSFPINIHDFVAMGLWSKFGAFRKFDQAAKESIHQAIRAVGLSGLENRPIGHLSGGQLQRARFARVALQDSPLVLLDEPYSAIDNDTVKDLAALVRKWNHDGKTIISVIHDYEHVYAEYREVLLLAREAIVMGKPAEVLDEKHLTYARSQVENRSGTELGIICNQDSVDGEHSH